MGLFGSSSKSALRLDDVTGSLDLERKRDGAEKLGMRVVGVRVVRKTERPVDGEHIAGTTGTHGNEGRTALRVARAAHVFGRASPAPPAWAMRPGQFSAYPPAWELGLLRFAAAFQKEEARHRMALMARRLPVPKQTGRYLIEPVGVEAWMRYVGKFHFSSLDVTPPRFELRPHVIFGSTAEPSVATTLDRTPADAHSGDGFAENGDEPSSAETNRVEARRDPYAFYRLVGEGRFVYHLYEDGLDAAFDAYWLTKFPPLVKRGLAHLEESSGSFSKKVAEGDGVMTHLTWIESHDHGMRKFTYDDEQRGLHIAVIIVPREKSPFSWIAALDGRPVGDGGSPALDDAGDAAMAAIERAELARM